MSSFLPLDELEPTLTDVLAFIDTFDSNATTPTSSSNSSSSSTSSEDGNDSPRKSPEPQDAVERRKTRKAAASRRCQQKKRAELLALRAQVVALECRLKELKPAAGRGGSLLASNRLDSRQKLSVMQLWRDKARLEQQLRLQSEEKNRELVAVVARQSRVAQAVRDMLSNVTAVVHIEEALRTPPPTNTLSVMEGFVPNLNDAIYGELSARLGRLYVDVSAKLTSVGSMMPTDVSMGVQVKREAVTGVPYVEFKTAMATNLDLQQTYKVTMSGKSHHYNKYRKYLTDLGMKKESEYELRDEEIAVALSTLSLSRSYEEENHKLLTFSSLVRDHPTDTGMRFHEEGFILMMRSSINPLGGTVIQTCYRLTPEVCSEPFSPTSSVGMATQDTEATKLFVLQNLGGLMWSTVQRIQASCSEAQHNATVIPAAC